MNPKFYDRAIDTGEVSDDKKPVYRLATYFLHNVNANLTIEREARDEDKDTYPAEFAAFERSRQPEADGFPLAAWTGVNAADRQSLADRGIYTVEQLAETDMKRAPQEIRDLQDKAKDFLKKTSEDGPKLATRIAELEEENAALKEQADDMRSAIESLKADLAKAQKK